MSSEVILLNGYWQNLQQFYITDKGKVNETPTAQLAMKGSPALAGGIGSEEGDCKVIDWPLAFGFWRCPTGERDLAELLLHLGRAWT